MVESWGEGANQGGVLHEPQGSRPTWLTTLLAPHQLEYCPKTLVSCAVAIRTGGPERRCSHSRRVGQPLIVMAITGLEGGTAGGDALRGANAWGSTERLLGDFGMDAGEGPR